MDLIRIIQYENLGENRYVCVYCDDYSKIQFIHEKPHTSTDFDAFFHHLQCEKEEDIAHDFCTPIYPQPIGIVEIKNHTLYEMEKVKHYAI